MFDNKKQAVMKKYTFIKAKTVTLVTLLALFLSSCGSYQYVGSTSDGIYGEDESKGYTVIEDAPETTEASSDYYSNYFREKGLDAEEVTEEEEVFTDVDSYSSNTEQQVTNNSGWGEGSSNVTINVYNNGWNNWGWNSPYYGRYGWNNWGYNSWGYQNIGWNNWGWSNWGWNNNWNHYGWNNWGWNGGFYNGWNNPYYSYYGNGYYNGYRRGYAYNNSRRGSYRSSYLGKNAYSSRSRLGTKTPRTSKPRVKNTPRTRPRANSPRTSQPRTKPRAVKPRRSPRASSPRTSTPRSSSPRSYSTPRSSSPRSYSTPRSSSSSSRGTSRSSSRRPR